ncbi:hypothetical protein [Streptomyces sp. NPDC051286]|uniref:hypothetical protein n=1 Tax=Streptomyces sp. NPDC051286 TaxID=3365647 RepID=UPI0037BC3EF1
MPIRLPAPEARTMPQARPRKVILGLLPWPERQAVAEALRTETAGGLILLAAALARGPRR